MRNTSFYMNSSPNNLPKNLFLSFIVPLDHDHDGIAGFEI